MILGTGHGTGLGVGGGTGLLGGGCHTKQLGKPDDQETDDSREVKLNIGKLGHDVREDADEGNKQKIGRRRKSGEKASFWNQQKRKG